MSSSNRGSVRVAERVWPVARTVQDEQDEGTIGLLLVPEGDHREAERALEVSVQEVAEQFEAEGNPETGEWRWVRACGGVLIDFGDSWMFEAELQRVADALGRRGVGGTIDLYTPPATTLRVPLHADLIECRVRVRGRRRSARDTRAYFWDADPDAHADFVRAAEHWRRRTVTPVLEESLAQDGLPMVPIPVGEDVSDRLSPGPPLAPVMVLARTEAGLRSVACRPYTGSVSLVVAGSAIEGGKWRDVVGEITEFLAEHADLLAYAHVRRGWAYWAAFSAHELSTDWPVRDDSYPRGTGFVSESFEDVYAPDAFGVQLLGPGYAGRTAAPPHWELRRAGSDSVLLQHKDQEAWFSAPLVPFAAPFGVPHPVPQVLQQARIELETILYAPGVLSRAGYVEHNERI